MLFTPLSVKFLQKAAKDALSRNEYGLILWATDLKWRHQNGLLTVDSNEFKTLADTLLTGKMCWVDLVKREVSSNEKLMYNLAVPANELATSLLYCKEVMESCNSYGIEGPISLFPSVHLSALYFNPSLC